MQGPSPHPFPRAEDNERRTRERPRKIRGGRRRPLPGGEQPLLESEVDLLPVSMRPRDMAGNHHSPHPLRGAPDHHFQIDALLRTGDPSPNAPSGLPLPPFRRISEKGLGGLTSRGEGSGHLHVTQPVGLIADPIPKSDLILTHTVPIVSRHSLPSPFLQDPRPGPHSSLAECPRPAPPMSSEGRKTRVFPAPDLHPEPALTPPALPIIVPIPPQ